MVGFTTALLTSTSMRPNACSTRCMTHVCALIQMSERDVATSVPKRHQLCCVHDDYGTSALEQTGADCGHLSRLAVEESAAAHVQGGLNEAVTVLCSANVAHEPLALYTLLLQRLHGGVYTALVSATHHDCSVQTAAVTSH